MLKSTSACSPALLVELPFQTLGQVWFLAVSNETVAAGAFQKVTWRCCKLASLSRLPCARCLARPDACPRACVRGKGVGKAGRSAPPEFLIQRKR